MNRCQQMRKELPQPEPIEPDVVLEWPSSSCEPGPREFMLSRSPVAQPLLAGFTGYLEDWTASVPDLIKAVSVQFTEKKQLELRANLLEIVISEFASRIEKLESSRAIIVPVNTFAPEPYELLKPILVSVQATGDEFEAGWFDANIHTTGENQEEAVGNLKSLILDYFDSYSKEKPERLGIEPKRQFEVLKSFVQRKS